MNSRIFKLNGPATIVLLAIALCPSLHDAVLAQTALWAKATGGGGADTARAIALDGAGNVYVAGSDSNGDNFDYKIVSYDPDGDLRWETTYNGPADDDDHAVAIVYFGGFVYVTGYSMGGGTEYDYATLKINAATGSYSATWPGGGVQIYDGVGSDDDRAVAIAVSGGFVFVTGYSWNGADYDFVTVRYEIVDGDETVCPAYDFGGTDRARAIAVSGGYVFVTGESYGGSFTNYDYAVVKYRADNCGIVDSQRYDGPGRGNDFPKAIAVSGAFVYVTGYSDGLYGTGVNNDYATLKLEFSDLDFSSSWPGDGFGPGVRRYNGSDNGDDRAIALSVSGGIVFVTGRTTNGGDSDFLTVKYGAVGGAWAGGAFFDSGGNDYATAHRVLGDALYVTGYVWNGANFDWRTVKFDATTGSFLWATPVAGGGAGNDYAYAIAVNSTGVYVTGGFWNGANRDFMTAKILP
jgi:hypothetical protein